MPSSLTAGVRYTITLEYYERGCDGEVALVLSRVVDADHPQSRLSSERQTRVERMMTTRLADASGNVLGQVGHELALPVANVASTCNQLRMDVAATDAEVLKTLVHFDAQVAGFDSRDGSIPKALGVLCAAG